MPGMSSSGVLKIWLYAAASVLLGSWSVPLLYNAGKALAEVSQFKDTNSPLEWLAHICQRTAFPGFFVASLLISAGILFLPFLEWLKGGRAAIFKSTPSQPPPGDGSNLPPVKKSTAWLQATMGFLIMTLLFLLLAAGFAGGGALHWKASAGAIFPAVWRGFAIAMGFAIFQEILFRGIALGTFLRAMRPTAAIIMTAALFAFVHFLNPPPGVDVVDPDASGVGFELLRGIIISFFNPRVFFDIFIPLFALGGLLAYARWDTSSPGLSTGLQTGWIFSHHLIDALTSARGKSVLWGLSDDSLRHGAVPLLGIAIIGFLVIRFTAPRHAIPTPN